MRPSARLTAHRHVCNIAHACVTAYLLDSEKRGRRSGGTATNQHPEAQAGRRRTRPLAYLYMCASVFAFHYAKNAPPAFPPQ